MVGYHIYKVYNHAKCICLDKLGYAALINIPKSQWLKAMIYPAWIIWGLCS